MTAPALVRALALLAAAWTLHTLLSPRRPVCLATSCRARLDENTVAYDLTGGNRAAAAYHCRSCGTVMTVHVPTPGGAVTEQLPTAEAAG